MKDLRQLLHEELDRIFDELSKNVSLNDCILNLEIVADEGVNSDIYNHVVVMAELMPDAKNVWSTEARDWRKDVVDLTNDGRTIASEHGEWGSDE